MRRLVAVGRPGTADRRRSVGCRPIAFPSQPAPATAKVTKLAQALSGAWPISMSRLDLSDEVLLNV
jgi:hypothetical protein